MCDLGQVDAVFRALYPNEMGPDLISENAMRWMGSRELAEQTKRNSGSIPVVLTNPQSPLGIVAREWLRHRRVSYDVIGEEHDITNAMKLVANGAAVSPLPGFVFDGNPALHEDCVEVIPGGLEIRYGMFFDDKRFNLRLAMDIFELLQGELHRMPPPAFCLSGAGPGPSIDSSRQIGMPPRRSLRGAVMPRNCRQNFTQPPLCRQVRRARFQIMRRLIQNARSDAQTDAQIDALLSPQDEVSIVDSLFTMSKGHGHAGARDVLERVLEARLEARLARRMRQTIEQSPGNDDKRPRSAA